MANSILLFKKFNFDNANFNYILDVLLSILSFFLAFKASLLLFIYSIKLSASIDQDTTKSFVQSLYNLSHGDMPLYLLNSSIFIFLCCSIVFWLSFYNSVLVSSILKFLSFLGYNNFNYTFNTKSLVKGLVSGCFFIASSFLFFLLMID